MLPVGDLARRRFDRVGLFGGQAVPTVHPRRRLLDQRERMNDLDRHPLARAEREILDRTLRLRAPIGVRRDRDLADAVALDPRAAHPINILVTATAPAQISATRPRNCQ